MLKRITIASALLVCVQVSEVFAATVAVGTCKPSLTSYTTIQGAVNAAPAGSTVLVCPGTYAEQVTIAQPLSLEGVASGGSDLALINGQSTQVFSPFLGTHLTVQILVSNAGPVNISNLTVDGTGTCADAYSGNIYYSNSYGTANHVVVRGAVPGGSSTCGTGLYVENDGSSPLSVNVQNSSFYNLVGGISSFSNSTPSALVVTIKNNFFNAPSGLGGAAIYYSQATGTASGNVSSGFLYGSALDKSAVTTISSNVITGASTGIRIASAGNTVTNNQLLNLQHAIVFAAGANNNTVRQNRIATNNLGGGGANDTGINFGTCSPAVTGNTVSGNTISDKSIGIFFIPSGNSVSKNSFFNVGIIANYCQ